MSAVASLDAFLEKVAQRDDLTFPRFY